MFEIGFVCICYCVISLVGVILIFIYHKDKKKVKSISDFNQYLFALLMPLILTHQAIFKIDLSDETSLTVLSGEMVFILDMFMSDEKYTFSKPVRITISTLLCILSMIAYGSVLNVR